MHQSEEDFLVLAAQDGDRRAIGLLYRHYHQRLFRYAYRLCGTRDMAQEAVQNTWIRAMKTISRLEDPRAFRSWLYRMIRWHSIDLLRVANRYTEEQENALEEAAAPASGVADDVDELRLAINRLPHLERQIIHLFYLDELSVREVAVVLNIPAGTVKSRLNRARTLLKQRFNIDDEA